MIDTGGRDSKEMRIAMSKGVITLVAMMSAFVTRLFCMAMKPSID